jgi:hypothetical protein
MRGGPTSNRSKCLLIVTIVLLTRFIALGRAIRAGLDLIDPLAHDRNSRRARDKIPSVCTLKSNNLLNHSKLSLRISNNIVIGGRLGMRDYRA